MNTTTLDNDPTIIRKFHPQNGLSYWSTLTRTWVLDEQGQPVAIPRPQGPPRPQVRLVTLARKITYTDQPSPAGPCRCDEGPAR